MWGFEFPSRSSKAATLGDQVDQTVLDVTHLRWTVPVECGSHLLALHRGVERLGLSHARVDDQPVAELPPHLHDKRDLKLRRRGRIERRPLWIREHPLLAQ